MTFDQYLLTEIVRLDAKIDAIKSEADWSSSPTRFRVVRMYTAERDAIKGILKEVLENEETP